MNCRWSHDWGIWKETSRGVITQGSGENKREIGKFIMQERECNRCKFKELNHQKEEIL